MDQMKHDHLICAGKKGFYEVKIYSGFKMKIRKLN